MIKDTICSGREDFTFFVACDCRRELIQFYYYKETNLCPEIIGIRFFGHVNGVNPSFDRNITLNRDEFNILLDAVKNNTTVKILDRTHFFVLKRDNYGFVHLINSINEKQYNKNNFVWDIVVHKSVTDELIYKLEEFKYFMEAQDA